MNEELKNIVEALLMVSDTPLSVVKIQGLFDADATPSTDEIKLVIKELQADCDARGIELVKVGNGYRYQSKLQYAQWIRKFQAGKPPRLSRAQLETLAIIAYRQPVTRGDIEEVRGVTVSQDIMQRLLEREWVKQVGVRDVPGRPALFGTTAQFLSYFNLRSLADLPDLMEQRALSEVAKDMNIGLSDEVLQTLIQDNDPQQSLVGLNEKNDETTPISVEVAESTGSDVTDE